MNFAENARKTLKSKKIRIIALLSVILILITEVIRSNSYIEICEYEFKSKLVPESFDGVKIVQISDFHNQGKNFTDRLVEKAKLQAPDYVFITGDTCDSRLTDIEDAEYFLSEISKIAECYLIWGNHDYNITDAQREQLRKTAENNGITVLESSYAYIERDEERVFLVGTSSHMDSRFTVEMLEDFPRKEGLTMWLHHYPEDFTDILETSQQHGNQADIVFSGHAHGGLIGLPFNNGAYAPGQGILPEYTSGMYTEGESAMLVSRGVGNSSVTLRFADSFQLVVLTLKKE